MVDRQHESELSPLDQIRLTEAEVTRRIAAVHESADQMVENAREQSAAAKREAQEVGLQEGQGRYKEIIADAEEEARTLIAEAHYQAAEIRRRGQQRMKIGVRLAVNLVKGNEEAKFQYEH